MCLAIMAWAVCWKKVLMENPLNVLMGILGNFAKVSSALLTLIERNTHYIIICKLDNLKAEDTARAAIRVLKAHKARVHTSPWITAKSSTNTPK